MGTQGPGLHQEGPSFSTIATFEPSVFSSGIKVRFCSASKYLKFPFAPSCVGVGSMADAHWLRQYLLAGLSCAVIKIQLVGSDKMLAILVDSHLYGNKIYQEAFRVYLENLHEICNFYPDINWVFWPTKKNPKKLDWPWWNSGGQKSWVGPLKDWVNSLVLMNS